MTPLNMRQVIIQVIAVRRMAETSTAFEDWKNAMEKMLEWKQRCSPATVQRLEDERLAQVQASATIARGGV